MTPYKIYLLPLGFEDVVLFDSISSAVERTFDLAVDRLSPAPLPEYAYNESRGQYHSTTILKSLSRVVPRDALRLLGITDVDIYVPQLNYVFGEAAVDGTVSLISLHRLRPEFYGKAPNYKLFTERAIKEAIHELGHTFGLRHCQDPHCVMFFSTGIEDTDRKSAEFRGECADRLVSKLRMLRAAA